MRIEFDNNKRNKTLQRRGLDFARADQVFANRHFTLQDKRKDYGEDRFITAGILNDRMVVLVWTQRSNVRRIISMRKANEREQKRYKKYLG